MYACMLADQCGTYWGNDFNSCTLHNYYTYVDEAKNHLKQPSLCVLRRKTLAITDATSEVATILHVLLE